MAAFKVGQRVRIVACDMPNAKAQRVVGREAVIARASREPWRYEWEVDVPGFPAGDFAVWAFHSHQLAPLTDPSADAFIERLKKLEREPVNVTVKA